MEVNDDVATAGAQRLDPNFVVSHSLFVATENPKSVAFFDKAEHAGFWAAGRHLARR